MIVGERLGESLRDHECQREFFAESYREIMRVGETSGESVKVHESR